MNSPRRLWTACKDDFTAFNENLWLKSDHMLGRSQLDPNNVSVTNGCLMINIPANTLDGGEIQSTRLFGYGTYRIRMKLPNAPSSITGFFLYKAPDFYNEIDIAIYNDSTGTIMFTTDARGQQTHTTGPQETLGFDPTAEFHEYGIDFHRGGVSFYVDGVLRQSWNDGVTENGMYLMVNTWFPVWLAGQAPGSDKYTCVDWIRWCEDEWVRWCDDEQVRISPHELPYIVTAEMRCAESLLGVCLRREITRLCIGGNCFDVTNPRPPCVRCYLALGAVLGLLAGAIGHMYLGR